MKWETDQRKSEIDIIMETSGSGGNSNGICVRNCAILDQWEESLERRVGESCVSLSPSPSPPGKEMECENHEGQVRLLEHILKIIGGN